MIDILKKMIKLYNNYVLGVVSLKIIRKLILKIIKRKMSEIIKMLPRFSCNFLI